MLTPPPAPGGLEVFLLWRNWQRLSEEEEEKEEEERLWETVISTPALLAVTGLEAWRQEWGWTGVATQLCIVSSHRDIV